jgi:RNA polymerase sigma-70 factor (ECF subfamily)
MQRDLERAIAQLPVKARMILVMHDIEGMTHHEIAKMMSVSVGTCKAQLHRARNLLKESLL